MNMKKTSLGLLFLAVALVIVPGASATPTYYGVLQSIYGGPPTTCQADCHDPVSYVFTHYGNTFKAQPNYADVTGGGTYAALVAIGPPLATITVKPSTASLTVSQTQTFTAATLDLFGNQINANVTWTSSDPAVGTIDPITGVFTASGAGTATITATGGGSGSGTITGTATATVSAPVQEFNVTFVVTDSANSPIQGASVVMNGIKKTTDATGAVVFNAAAGVYKYTVSMRGYKRYTNSISITSDTTVPVTLVHR